MKPVEEVVHELLSNKMTTHEYYFQKNEHLALERANMHQQIIDSVLTRQPYSQNRNVYMLGGAPANGKTTLLNSGYIPHPEDALKLDADEIKLLIPEFKYMIERKEPLAAAITHQESTNLNDRIRDQALIQGYSKPILTSKKGLQNIKQTAARWLKHSHNLATRCADGK